MAVQKPTNQSSSTTSDIGRAINKIEKEIKSVTKIESASGELYEIGKPAKFPNEVDPNDRAYKLIKSKMNVIDIVPCEAKVPFEQIMKKGLYDTSLSVLFPQISYGDNITKFKNMCQGYGLESNYIGVRLLTTDQTTVSDSFTNEFQENFFQSQANALSTNQKAASLRNVLDSLNTSGKYKEEIKKMGESMAGTIIDLVAGKDSKIGATAKNITSQLLDMIVKGEQVSLPKIWKSSSYSPSMNINLKLVSPYGHPTAVKEYIIKPLMYLLILGSPETSNGITYGRTFTFSVKAYGLGFYPYVAIQNITFRRGGNDISYNIYHQPLTLDVSITLSLLVDGFGAFKEAGKFPAEANVLNNADKFFSDETNFSNAEYSALFQTVGSVINSLRPINLVDINIDASKEYTLDSSNDVFGSDNTISPVAQSSVSSQQQSLPLTSNMDHSDRASAKTSADESISDVMASDASDEAKDAVYPV